MPGVRLTQRRVDALAPRRAVHDVRDTQLKGYGVRVMPSGAKRYFIHSQHRGRRVRKTVADARDRDRDGGMRPRPLDADRPPGRRGARRGRSRRHIPNQINLSLPTSTNGLHYLPLPISPRTRSYEESSLVPFTNISYRFARSSTGNLATRSPRLPAEYANALTLLFLPSQASGPPRWPPVAYRSKRSRKRSRSRCRHRVSTPVEDSAKGRRKRLPPGLVG